ncbi:SpoIIE family protein phosphatase [Oceanobacillus halotolerans]|uniref:SpoIIE family protein phosphatase n=1 Tax=Oceanobacillus halotolerans TaxID=2663380 RepID=UPI0013DC716D|nr:SpoIIE family protein phosphatase [Oceanobacillus halotolerans]
MSIDWKKMEVAIFQQAKKGNHQCGDSYFYTETENEFICALADGLGSGDYAKESSRSVIDTIQQNAQAPVEQIIKCSNKNLHGKRGAVLGILKIDFSKKEFTFSSIGNIGVMTITADEKKQRIIPNAGYLAGYASPYKTTTEKLKPNMRFFMFSDGVTDRDLHQPFFSNRKVSEITKSFAYMTESSRTDDTTLIAMRYTGDED